MCAREWRRCSRIHEHGRNVNRIAAVLLLYPVVLTGHAHQRKHLHAQAALLPCNRVFRLSHTEYFVFFGILNLRRSGNFTQQ